MGRGGTDAMRYKPVRTTEDLEYQLALRNSRRRCRCSSCCKAFLILCLTLLVIIATAGLVAYSLYPDSVSILVKVIRAEVKETRERFFPKLGHSGENEAFEAQWSRRGAMEESLAPGGNNAFNSTDRSHSTFESDKYLLSRNKTETDGAEEVRETEGPPIPLEDTTQVVQDGLQVAHQHREGVGNTTSPMPPATNSTDLDFEDDDEHPKDFDKDIDHEMEFFETFRPLASNVDRFVHSGAALVVAVTACLISLSVAAYFIVLTCRRRRRLRRLERLSEELRNESNRFLIQHDDSDDDTDDRLSPKAITKKERIN